MMNLFLTNTVFVFASQDVNWCTGVVWIIVMFLSAVWTDGTHSLQMIHWWASYVMLHFSKSFLMKKQTHLHLERSANVHFWGNHSFNNYREVLKYFVCFPVDLDSYHLKERLSENEDFVLVPAEAWHKLLSWYDMMDDQPPLERKVVLTRLLTFLSIQIKWDVEFKIGSVCQ